MTRRRTQTTTIRGYDRLIASLGPDFTQASEAFNRLRLRLVRLLAWRGTSDPEALADETLERVARQLGGGLEIKAEDPYHYAARVAHLVAHEDLRTIQRQQKAHQAASEHTPNPSTDAEGENTVHMDCLESCLEELTAEDQQMILVFYRGEKGSRIAGRRALAEQLGISANALRIRAFRLRQRLEQCVRDRLDELDDDETSSPRGSLLSRGDLNV